MTTQTQPPQGAGLAPGTLISGRFEVEAFAAMVGTVPIWSAKDRKVARSASLWMFSGHGLDAARVEEARKSIRGAAGLQHQGLVVPFGSAVTGEGALCVASEQVPAMSLADVLAQKRAAGQMFSLAQCFPYIAQIVDILHGHVHPNLAHGAIAPATVRFDGSHIRLAGMGMLPLLVASGTIAPHSLAPELRAGAAPTPQSDVYAVGALLYELLTGRPADPNVSVSSLVPGTPVTLDVMLDECLAHQPHERFDNITALKSGLASILGPLADVVRDEIDIPIEFSEHPKPVEYTIPPGAFDDPKHSPAMVSGVRAAVTASAPPGPDADLGSLLKAATKNDSDRWMFSHDGLDHGPMTARDLIAAIVRGEVMETDAVTNMDTSEKKPLTQWPQYREFAETAVDKRREEARKAATTEAMADAGVARTSKLLIAGAALVAFALIGVVYYKTMGAGGHQTRSAAEIDDLVQRGELRVQTQSIQLLPPPPPDPHRRAGGGGGGHGGFTSYESAMAQAIDYNFGGAGSPSGASLSDSEITRPLTSNLSRFAGCLSDGSARNVTLRLAIGGTGRAIGVTVASGSPALKSCVAGVVRSLSWRAFGGPRIGLSWGFGF